MKMDMNISGNDVLNSTHALSFWNQSTNILSLLMTRQGWNDPKESIRQETLTAQDKQQRLTEAFENYAVRSDVARVQALMELLQEAESDLKSEYDYAKKQQAFYEIKAEKEAKSGGGFIADWMEWARQGVQDFFGSSNSGLADKYSQMAETRQSQLKELSQFKRSLQQKISLENTEQEEDITELDFPVIETGQRRHLQSFPDIQTLILEEIPDQTISASQIYNYPIDGTKIFNVNFSTLIATSVGQNVIQPSWLQFYTTDLVGSYTATSANYRAIKVLGNFAYIADYGTGLKIFNITNPAAPILTSSYSAGNLLALEVNAEGNFVYLANANNEGLQVINVSNPFEPILVGNYPLPGSSSCIAINGDFVYVASGSSAEPISMFIFNVSDPGELQSPIGSWSTTSPFIYGGVPVGLQIQDHFAYIGTVTSPPAVYNVLYTIDISNPQRPILFATFQSPTFLGWYPYLAAFKIANNFIYLTQGNNLIIIDITNPGNQLSNIHITLEGIRAFEISGDLLYFSADDQGIKIVNVSDPYNPTPAILAYGTFGSVYDFQIANPFVYVADADGGLKIIDLRKNGLVGTPPVNGIGEEFNIRISACTLSGTVLAYEDFQLTIDSNLPQAIGSIPDQSIFPGTTLQLSISSNLLFSNADLHQLNLQLKVIDSSGNSYNPWIHLGIFPSLASSINFNTNVHEIVAQGNYAYAALNTGGLAIINITNPNNPQILSTSSSGITGTTWHLNVINNLVYVVADSNGLVIFDVSNPLAPTMISNYNRGWSLRGLYLQSISSITLAYLTWCCNPAVLEIIDITNPQAIQSLGQLSSGMGNIMNPIAIQVKNGIAYIGNSYTGNNGVPQNQTFVVNVTSPTNPQPLASYPITNDFYSLIIQRNLLYVAGTGQGLLIFNITDPTNHSLLSENTYGGRTNQVMLQGDLAYIADGIADLEIIDVSDPIHPQLICQTDFPGLYSADVQKSFVYTGDGGDTNFRILDISQRAVIATPTTADIGNYQATLIATDELGATASINFKIFVEGPPVINGSIPAQYAKIGQLYNYFVPQGVVSDPNDDPITFSAIQQGRSNLMPWLSFNSISATFAGTPLEGDKGNFIIVLSATDHISGTVDTTFNMLVSHLPVVKQAIPSQVANIGILYQYAVSAATFFSQEGFALFYSAQQTNGLSLPAWLKFNSTALQFLGLPNNTDTGVYSLEIIASDEYQGQTAAVFSLTVEHFPSMNPLISLQPPLAGVGLFFSWAIPSNAFMDLDNNPFTYSATQTDGAPLPNWLSFNPQSLIFSGTPSALDVKNLSLQLVATDLNSGEASRNFTITVTYFPIVMTAIPRQLVNIGVSYNYTISNRTFSEADQAVLLYSVQQSNGQALPQWLSFDSITQQLSGWPNVTDTGSYLLEVSATNPVGAAASINFPLIVEYFPQVNNLLQPPLVAVGRGFNWIVPSNAFIDLDDNVLTYTASQGDGSLLPNWLSFNPSSLAFSGTPSSTDVETVLLQLTATDSDGAHAQQQFNLTITNFPFLATAIPNQLLNMGVPYNYTLPAGTFSEADQAVLLYSVQQSNGRPLPGWLNFNKMTRQLSGSPNATVAGTYLLKASATNPEGASATTDFSLIVEHFPEVFYPIPPQLADINQLFSFTLPVNSFLDQDGEPLTYTTMVGSGGPLPNWLVFNPQNQFYSGVPLETNQGNLSLLVIAADPAGAFASSNLIIQVIHFPTVETSPPSVVVRAGESFSFTIAKTTFANIDGTKLSYSTGPLPDWLSFDSLDLNFSGQASLLDVGDLPLTLMATDTRGAEAAANFKLIVRGNQPPQVTTSLSTQVATVHQAFSFFLPTNLFIDSNNNSLMITAGQQGGLPVPEWLSFDNQTFEFSGVPGYGDTNFYAVRTLSIEVTAASQEGEVSDRF